MSNYTATVIKTGNSYALRVPKSYVDVAGLTLGQKVEIPEPITPGLQDKTAITEAIAALRQCDAYSAIREPVSWQQDVRRDRVLPERQ